MMCSADSGRPCDQHGAATRPGHDAASENALNGASVEVGESSFGRLAKLLVSPQEV